MNAPELACHRFVTAIGRPGAQSSEGVEGLEVALVVQLGGITDRGRIGQWNAA